jgi:hypothetical protein
LGKKLFCDISILIDSSSKAGLQKLKELATKEKALYQKIKAIDIKGVEPYLNGYCRQITYVQEADQKNFAVVSVMEGRMLNGMFDGFARCFEVKQLSMHAKVGFWKPANGVSVPYGKFWWVKNGDDLCEKGVWFGVLEKYRIRLLREVRPEKFEDFKTNVTIKKVPKLPSSGFLCCSSSV